MGERACCIFNDLGWFVGASLAAKENKHIVVGIPEKLFLKKYFHMYLYLQVLLSLRNNFNCLSRLQLCLETKGIGETSLAQHSSLDSSNNYSFTGISHFDLLE